MNLLLPDSGLLFWMTIIFAIVFFLLSKFGFPVITGMVEKRTKKIDEALRHAEEAEARLTHLSQEQGRIIGETRKEQARLLQEASAERDRMVEIAREQAREEAQKIMDEAKARIIEEKEAALRDVRKEVAALSVSIAEKVMRKQLAQDKEQKELIDRMLDEI